MCGHVQRRFLAQPPRIDLRPIGQQQPDNPRLPLQRRQMQRRAAVLSSGLSQLRVRLQERLYLLRVADAYRVKEVRAAPTPASRRQHLGDRHQNENGPLHARSKYNATTTNARCFIQCPFCFTAPF
jgi:hypothetical protein